MQENGPVPMSDSTLQRLLKLRSGLLRLHKLLLDDETESYQRAHGYVSKGQLFQLVIQDEWFAWLRPISQLIARIDEVLHSIEPFTEADAGDLFGTTRSLLRPAEAGMGFERKYFDALQSDPDVILAHRDVSRLIAARG